MLIDHVFLFQGHVIMGTQAADVQQQVIEKTSSILQKSQNLVWSMEKRLSSNKPNLQEPFTVF